MAAQKDCLMEQQLDQERVRARAEMMGPLLARQTGQMKEIE